MPNPIALRPLLSGGYVSPSFNIPLITSLAPTYSAGSGTPTVTRATTAEQTDFEGKQNLVLSGEARFQGARRVANLASSTQDSTGGNWTKTNVTTSNGQTDPIGGTGAIRVTATAGGGIIYLSSGGNTAGNTFVNSVWIKRITGTGTLSLRKPSNGSTTDVSGSVTASWKRFSLGTSTDAGVGTGYPVVLVFGTNSDAVDIAFPTLEDVTGQSNQNPGEYVSVGVLSGPPYTQPNMYGGASTNYRDGVGYSNYQNGNTVSSNVVTQAQGALIPAATTLGYYAEGQATQIIAATADIRDMTTANWTLGATMTRARTSVGADGAANSATRLTGGAVAATNTITYLVTAAASNRTYSALIKLISGSDPVLLTQLAATSDITAQLAVGQWRLVQFPSSQLNATIGIQINGTGGTVLDVDFNQFEAGSFATSRISTGGAQRNADVEQYVSAGNLNATAMSIKMQVTPEATFGTFTGWIWGTYVDANNATGILFDGTNLIARKRIGGANHDATIAWTPTAGVTVNVAARFDGVNGVDIWKNGVKGTNDSTMTASQIGTNFQVGSDGNSANQDYSAHRNFVAYPTSLSDSRMAQ